MNGKDKKFIQKTYARINIDKYFQLLANKFNPEYNQFYVKEIKKFSESFNIRLKRSEKLKFCKKCNTYFYVNNFSVRTNKKYKTLDYICKNCGYVKRIKFK